MSWRFAEIISFCAPFHNILNPDAAMDVQLLPVELACSIFGRSIACPILIVRYLKAFLNLLNQFSSDSVIIPGQWPFRASENQFFYVLVVIWRFTVVEIRRDEVQVFGSFGSSRDPALWRINRWSTIMFRHRFGGKDCLASMPWSWVIHRKESLIFYIELGRHANFWRYSIPNIIYLATYPSNSLSYTTGLPGELTKFAQLWFLDA